MNTPIQLIRSVEKASSLFSAVVEDNITNRDKITEMIHAAKEVLSSISSSSKEDSRRETVISIISTLETSLSLIETKDKLVNDCDDDKKMETDEGNKLDSFAAGRLSALESTLISDLSSLPLLSDIVGLKEAKESLLEALVDPLLYPEWFASSNLQPWRCVLLFGPPGTGKSALCGAIAREVGARFYCISSSDLISSWSGQSEKLIKSLFDMVLSNEEPSIIFMDEVDSLCRKRNNSEDDSNRRVKTELLVQLPRLQSSSSRVFLISATNCPWELDPAFLRRFEKKIYIGLPDIEAREELFSKQLNRIELDDDVSYEWLAKETEGLSGDDIRRLCTEIAFTHFRLYKEEKRIKGVVNRIEVTQSMISPIISRTHPTVSSEYMKQFERYTTQSSFTK